MSQQRTSTALRTPQPMVINPQNTQDQAIMQKAKIHTAFNTIEPTITPHLNEQHESTQHGVIQKPKKAFDSKEIIENTQLTHAADHMSNAFMNSLSENSNAHLGSKTEHGNEHSNSGDSSNLWKWIGGAALIGGAGIAIAAGGDSSQNGNGNENSKNNSQLDLASLNFDDASSEQIAASANDIRYAVEEEKLALDVYNALYLETGITAFDKISDSEQKHYDAVVYAANELGVDLAGLSTEAGVFSDPELQSIYNELIALGTQSRTDAINVGIQVENMDIIDLQEMMQTNEIVALDTIYQNLLDGSYNHLSAFTGLL